MGSGIDKIHEKINSFKRRYYLNLLVRGLLFSLSILFFYFLTAAVLESVLWLGPWGRFLILLLFFILVIYCAIRFFKEPVAFWIYKRGINDEQGARLIGNYFPSIKDRLVNLIQLSAVNESNLAQASILQKSKEFEPVAFESVIQLNQNKKYLKYLLVPAGIILLLLIFNQAIITQSAHRIVNFNQKFSPQAPFKFIIQNKSLTGFLMRISRFNSYLPEMPFLKPPIC